MYIQTKEAGMLSIGKIKDLSVEEICEIAACYLKQFNLYINTIYRVTASFNIDNFLNMISEAIENVESYNNIKTKKVFCNVNFLDIRKERQKQTFSTSGLKQVVFEGTRVQKTEGVAWTIIL
ncbi:hypothetical protein JTB14_024394 [Gonioctena quinquepunctata]|nr:hypothetical protein JTB14_024394 [Gonioctena quinquepunctata]